MSVPVSPDSMIIRCKSSIRAEADGAAIITSSVVDGSPVAQVLQPQTRLKAVRLGFGADKALR